MVTVIGWLDQLEERAPSVVAAFQGIEADRFLAVRREIRQRAGIGSAGRMAVELTAVTEALGDVVSRLPEPAFAMPGGEGDWNVAQAVGHVADARSGLALAAALAAQGRFPADAPTVVPGIPGDAAAERAELAARLERSQRVIDRSAVRVAGHEDEPCPLVHPLVGRLRCGEWLLFAGVHDLQHLRQLHEISRTVEGGGR